MTNAPPPGDQPAWNPPQSQPPPGYGGPGGYGASTPSSPSNGIGIAALVVGIVSLFLWWIPFIGVVISLVAVVLGVVGIRKASRGQATNKGMAIAGVVTGALSLLAAIIVTVLFVGFFSSEEFQNLTECLEQAQTAQEQQDCQTQFQEDFTQ